MAKRKRVTEDLGHVCHFHTFKDSEISDLKCQLLEWYDANKRSLPWRHEAKREDMNERAYAVWVSEIMLQQTQVATVIDYYNKWMKKWPTLQELSKATLEEVHQVWSGLGYYSRATRLREGALKVENELGGKIPADAESLEKQLPGVGRYTAGAIASIAFQQVTGIVDGNVMRVFSRLRAIGAEYSSQHFNDQIWKYANETVDKSRPGDYNQALMELGATVCTPKNPSCSTCPVKNICKAYQKEENKKKKNAGKLGISQKENTTERDIPDIEDIIEGCKLYLGENNSWDPNLGVCNYPRKKMNKVARKERTVVCLITKKEDSKTEYYITQRPPKGLLAGLWEFPNIYFDNGSDTASKPNLDSCLSKLTALKLADVEDHTEVGEVVHLFSHIHQTYLVHSIQLKSSNTIVSSETSKWVGKDELLESAISTAMKKVFKHYEASTNKAGQTAEQRKKQKVEKSKDGKKQLGLDSFFKKM